VSWAPPVISLDGNELICKQSGIWTNIPAQIAILDLIYELADLVEAIKRESAG